MSELWPALGTAFRQSVPFLCALLVLAGVVFFFARCCPSPGRGAWSGWPSKSAGPFP